MRLLRTNPSTNQREMPVKKLCKGPVYINVPTKETNRLNPKRNRQVVP